MRRVPIADTGLVIEVWVPGDGFFAQLQRGDTKLSWSNIETIMSRYYYEAAMELNLLAVEAFHETRKRPSVSTHRLETALLDYQNIRVLKDGFYAGDGKFLDSSNAKYWRQIEEGTSIHLGQLLTGVWGATLSGGWATSARGNTYALAGPAYTAHSGGSGGKFQPFSTFEGGKVGRPHKAAKRQNFEAGHAKVGYEAHIGRPIVAENYYGRAFDKFRKTNRPLNLLREVIASELGMSKSSIPRSYKGIREGL